MAVICLVVLALLYPWVATQPRISRPVGFREARPVQLTEPMVLTVDNWSPEPWKGFSVYSNSSEETIPISTFTGGGASSTFALGDVIPTTAWSSSTRRVTWAYNEVVLYAYDAVGNILTTYTLVPSNAPPIPEVSFKTVIPEPPGNSIALGTPVAITVAMVGSAVYRLEHFVGRVAITSLSGSREVSMLLVLISLMAVFLLRTLHLPGSFGPGGCTTVVATIATSTVCATTGSTDSSFKERIYVYQRPQRILRRLAV